MWEQVQLLTKKQFNREINLSDIKINHDIFTNHIFNEKLTETLIKEIKTSYSHIFLYDSDLDSPTNPLKTTFCFNDLSTMAFIETADNHLIYLERTTTFEYDKIINFRSSAFDVDSILIFCIRGVMFMSSQDRKRLYKKLTIDFWKIELIVNDALCVSRRAVFLYFWRTFLLDLINIFNQLNQANQPQFILPGGHGRKTETIYACALRELREETGLEEIALRKRFAYINITDKYSGEIYHNIALFGKTNTTSEELKKTFIRGSEISDIKFININDLSTFECEEFILDPKIIKELL